MKTDRGCNKRIAASSCSLVCMHMYIQDCISLLRCAYCNLDQTCSEAAKNEQKLQALLKFPWQGGRKGLKKQKQRNYFYPARQQLQSNLNNYFYPARQKLQSHLNNYFYPARQKFQSNQQFFPNCDAEMFQEQSCVRALGKMLYADLKVEVARTCSGTSTHAPIWFVSRKCLGKTGLQ